MVSQGQRIGLAGLVIIGTNKRVQDIGQGLYAGFGRRGGNHLKTVLGARHGHIEHVDIVHGLQVAFLPVIFIEQRPGRSAAQIYIKHVLARFTPLL